MTFRKEKQSCFLWLHQWGKWIQGIGEVVGHEEKRLIQTRDCSRCGYRQTKLRNV